jgi:hypothetical protein
MNSTIYDHSEENFVIYTPYDSINGLHFQSEVYDTCLQKHSLEHDFMAFIDLDEFIVVANKSRSIPSVLAEYQLNWRDWRTKTRLEVLWEFRSSISTLWWSTGKLS